MNQEIFKFAYGGNEYQIPSELYPLTHPEDAVAFNNRILSEVTDKKMIKVINSIDFEIGRCYDNSRKLEDRLVEAGFDACICSGWLFAGAMPIHHAWVFVRDEEKFHIIDASYHKVTDAVLKRVRGRGDVREEFKKLWKEELKIRKKNIDRIVAGLPPEHLLYVGNPDTYEDAVRMYKKISKIKTHPSYGGEMNISGDSELQISVRRPQNP